MTKQVALKDYTRAKFPIDLAMANGTTARLLGTINGRVFGALIFTHSAMAMSWNASGLYSDNGQHEHMDLPTLPADHASKIANMKAELAEIDARLDGNPGAPLVWRQPDIHRSGELINAIKKLGGTV